ncbi:MAG: hypothetical protein WCK59_01000 [Candidatus Falkowbacteria bacterium]
MKKNLRNKNILLEKAGLALVALALAFFVSWPTGQAKALDTLSPISAPVVGAGIPVVDLGLQVSNMTNRLLDSLKAKQSSFLNTWGSKILGATLRATLNRIAYDAANYVATAGEGQKPQYVVENFGDYWKNIGDAAAGDFIDSVGKSWQVDLCQPNAAIRANIGLGLIQEQRPSAPNCTLSQLTSNYTSAYEKYAAMKSGDYLKALQINFQPGGGEIGSAFTLFGRTQDIVTTKKSNEQAANTITQGWLDVRGVDGKLLSLPGNAKDTLANAKSIQAQGMLSFTGNALVDAANVFLNQLAYEGMQRVIREISKGKSSLTNITDPSFPGSAFDSVLQYGEKVISEKLATIIKPHFDVKSDYSILSDLSVCPDKKNPGPNNCVIDDNFSQAISEKVTVGEALNKGYLHGDWLVSSDNKADSTYTLRSATILRKFRIVPVGWEQAISLASSRNLKVTFQDLVSCFDGNGTFSADFNKNDQSWCRGLVDPNWVLKAPLNYCTKQGAGGQISSSLLSKDENGLSTVVISRNSDYCADEQTCIKEKADGSCETYGYCNEEKRTWKFNSDSCEPVYNTCQTFTSPSRKEAVSYLQNTLDYSSCNASNSGCKQYSYNGTYSSSTNKISWSKSSSIYLNSQATACDAAGEGCNKLYRGKPGWRDVNFVMNSNFELNNVGDTSTSTNWHWPVKVGVGSIIDGKSLNLIGATGTAVYSDSISSSTNLLPTNLTAVPGWSYTLSADVYLTTGDKVIMTLGDSATTTEMTTKNAWQTISLVASAGSLNTSNLNFAITGAGAQVNFSVRNIKLAPNNFLSPYAVYGLFPVYEKLLPAYLESACYVSSGDYHLKPDAPSICNNYARKCNREEVGCELFTSTADNFSVAAKANSADYCDAKCVGYDTYLAKASYFYGTSADNLIPASAITCSAESAGCASFTNLDAASSGGENLEYYSKVRQCIKPDTASCGDFYSWDNSQLKAMSLKKDASGNPIVVDAVSDALCSQSVYTLLPSDPAYNPDCREFYNKNGQITYHLFSNTISCSDNCHAYRLNDKNIDASLTAATCTGVDKSWDATQAACYVCKSGGLWSAKQNACVYQVVPNEGTSCSSEEVGCREYNGNNGANMRLVAGYDFESSLEGFTGISGATLAQSLESTSKNGHSLAYTGSGATAAMEVGAQGFAKKGSAYVIKFMAKAAVAVNTKIYFTNSDGAVSVFGVTAANPQGNLVIKADNVWNLYEINLLNLDHDVKAEQLVIQADNNLFLDHVVLSEISDRYYLIKGSSVIPDVCSYDMAGTYQGPNYNLGCAQYTDRSGIVNNLHRFSELCQDSAVGCEQMIQTNNSSDYYGYTLNLNNADQTVACISGTPGCITVKGHQAIYAVFDPSKQCNVSEAGCTRFGYSQTSGAMTNWADIYKKNLPDTYKSETASPLCKSTEVGCDTWSDTNGLKNYFKDPGLNTCVLKNNIWYKTPVKRCDANRDGKITGTEKDAAMCLTDTECGLGKCIMDTNDYVCPINYLKTFGFGGGGGRVATPEGMTGLCGAESSSCSEYIDPNSKFVSNLIYNPAAEDINQDGEADKWATTSVPMAGYYFQRINVRPNKLYILQVDGPAVQPVILDNFSPIIALPGIGTVRTLGATSTNLLNAPVSAIAISASSSVMFYTGANTYLNVSRYGTTTSTTVDKTSVYLREAIINYQLSSNLDTQTCNGVVNTDNGCVLFNSRTQMGASGLNKLTFAATPEGSAPLACDGNTNCIANSVIKVTPDRICSRWLSCRTYIEDPITKERTCYGLGECDLLNNKNECANFLPLDGVVRNIQNNQNKNATGYAILNDYYLGAMKEVGQNTTAHFDFENNLVGLSCRRDVDANGAGVGQSCSFDKNITDSLVLEPNGSPAGIDYPAHGKGYLKVLNYYQISPQAEGSSFSLYTNQDYYINYLVNTKGSSAKAKLLVTNEAATTTYARFIDTAPNGWERKVQRLRIIDTNVKQVKVKIYLTSDTTNINTGYVYYDDINIEPVLQTGPTNFVSKDCRLYPGDDSLTCLSANNNVIKDGLFGYCLQYDPLNPKVCLMWYPIDQIAPITRLNRSDSGYTGKFPLYYCSEANGNFQLLKKIKVFEVAHDFGGAWNEMYQSDSNIQNICIGLLGHRCEGTNICYSATQTQANTGVASQGDYGSNVYPSCGSSDYKIMINITATPYKYYMRIYCVPNSDLIWGTTGEDTSVNKSLYDSQSGCGFQDSWVPYNGSFLTGTVNSSDNGGAPSVKQKTFENVNDLGFTYDSKANFSAYNLKLLVTADPASFYHFTCNRFTGLVDADGNNQAWSGRTSRGSVFATSTPDFFYNTALAYSYMPSSATSTANSCTGTIRCSGSTLTQSLCTTLGCFWDPNTSLCQGAVLVSCNGLSNAIDCYDAGCTWGPDTASTTPNPHAIYLYGRNREDIPFGSAVLPSNYDLLTSDQISLRNQYSKKTSETLFAGRPYGCVGASCKYIGQCSLDPNVYCVYDAVNQEVNKSGCSAGGNGSCIHLWDSIVPVFATDSAQILNKIFIKKYSDYKYLGSGYTPVSVVDSFVTPPQCPGNIRPILPETSYCEVYPSISNITMKLGTVPVAILPATGGFKVTDGNMYQLEFNSSVDLEQQPLKEIVIKWGDGNIQIITNQDNKPVGGLPHKFYHYYAAGPSYQIEVKVIDNWDAWTCCKIGDVCDPAACSI